MVRRIFSVKTLSATFAVVFFCAAVVLLFVPFPSGVNGTDERYLCVWEDGSVTSESYVSAYEGLSVSSDFEMMLLRGGKAGKITPTPQYFKLIDILQSGGLNELLEANAAEVSPLERVAIWRGTRDTIWYYERCYVWGADGLTSAVSPAGGRLILLSGMVRARALAATCAHTLELRLGAEIGAASLVGTQIQTVVACAPYRAAENGILLDTDTAVRYVSGLPSANRLTVPAVDFIDRGALLPCKQLTELELPFAGSSARPSDKDFVGELRFLFSSGNAYTVPAMLKRVKIAGGVLMENAFFGFDSVENVDLCGMSSENIHADALLPLGNLRTVHAPTATLNLTGTYELSTAACGCTIYTRKG